VTHALLAVSGFGITRDLTYALQLALGFVFAFAAIPKIFQPVRFSRTISDYQLLPGPLTRTAAFCVITVESFLALAFLTGWLVAIAIPVAVCVLLSFAAGVAINLRRGRRPACGCFGNQGEPISGRSLSRLSILIAAVLLLAALPASPVAIGDLVDMGSSALRYLVEVAALTAFVLLAATWSLSLPELAFTLRHLTGGASTLPRTERRA
jgi:hypothetical protein